MKTKIIYLSATALIGGIVAANYDDIVFAQNKEMMVLEDEITSKGFEDVFTLENIAKIDVVRLIPASKIEENFSFKLVGENALEGNEKKINSIKGDIINIVSVLSSAEKVGSDRLNFYSDDGFYFYKGFIKEEQTGYFTIKYTKIDKIDSFQEKEEITLIIKLKNH